MKTFVLIALATASAVSAFAQGQINFKTISTKNAVFYSTDESGAPATLNLLPTSGQVGSYGTVQYEIYSAAPGSTFIQDGSGVPIFGTAWTGVAVPNPTYSSPGVISSVFITLGSGTAGNPQQIEIVAYIGTLANPIMIGYSGGNFNGGSFVFNGTTYSTGLPGWTNATGNPNNAPPDFPAALTAGSGGFGSIVLSVPEPSTYALGLVGAGMLLLFRRRK